MVETVIFRGWMPSIMSALQPTVS